MPLNTITVAFSTTPIIISTLLTHLLHHPPASEYGLSYQEGIALIRRFLEHASHHTVEELQSFTAMNVPTPSWVSTQEVIIPPRFLDDSAAHITAQLGSSTTWWRWRERDLRCEWISVSHKWWRGKQRSDTVTEKLELEDTARTLLYVHGGAYYFGSVDEHRYQLQRHARKLRARVFAPRYRLAPQFPFPCALYDVLAAYLFLVEEQGAGRVMIAGDSAGGGLVLALLCLCRDRGIPLPAGAVLISPWVDLCHSMPSVMGDASGDYIPSHGFMHRASEAWPPLPREVVEDQEKAAAELDPELIQVTIDGTTITIHDQIQMYAPNSLLTHPLVSPINQPTLGGLCPLLVLTGGRELLRDEQLYIAHKAAFPGVFGGAGEYPPTKVHLQVFEHACHVLPALAWTKPAKRMARSIAGFAEEVWGGGGGKDMPGFRYEIVGEGGAVRSERALTPAEFPDEERIGVFSEEPVRRWMEVRKRWEVRYRRAEGRRAVVVGQLEVPASAAYLRRGGAGGVGREMVEQGEIGRAHV